MEGGIEAGAKRTRAVVASESAICERRCSKPTYTDQLIEASEVMKRNTIDPPETASPAKTHRVSPTHGQVGLEEVIHRKQCNCVGSETFAGQRRRVRFATGL